MAIGQAMSSPISIETMLKPIDRMTRGRSFLK